VVLEEGYEIRRNGPFSRPIALLFQLRRLSNGPRLMNVTIAQRAPAAFTALTPLLFPLVKSVDARAQVSYEYDL
jgi:hypothetical protein